MRMKTSRRGYVLIMVLVVVVALALSAYSFTALMFTENEATSVNGRRIQSRYLVDSGMESIRIFLSLKNDEIRELGDTYDNAIQFQAIQVFASPDDPAIGYVTVVAPALDDDGNMTGFRFGLVDESTKLNLNTLPTIDQQMPDGGRTLLLNLPGMTEDIADSIMDYIDSDEDQRDYGAEAGYYQGLDPPYSPKNGPLDNIEELLLIRGITPELLYGLDYNHNGVLDDQEQSGLGAGVDPSMALGWANYLTLWSKERNFTREGLPRININQEDLTVLDQQLRTVFSSELVTFILAMRLNGPYTGTGTPAAIPIAGELDLTQSPQYTFNQVLDLVDAVTSATFAGEEEEVVFESPIKSLGLGIWLPQIMEHLTTMAGDTIPGRINISQAPATILAGIPGMTEEILSEILSRRDVVRDDDDPNRDYETWILAEAIVDLQTMRSMLPFICVKGDVYRAELVGYFDDGVGTSRAEAIIDRTEVIPRVLFWRDKSHLPLGYQLDMLGTQLHGNAQ